VVRCSRNRNYLTSKGNEVSSVALQVVDHSGEATLIMFGVKWEDLPVIRHAGTIIRLHGLTQNTYCGKVQLKWNKEGSWALFHHSGRETTPFEMSWQHTEMQTSEEMLGNMGALSAQLFQSIQRFDPYMTLLQ